MAAADPALQKLYQRRWYEKNRQRCIDGAKRRQDVQRWRAKRKAAGLKVNGDWDRRQREYVNAAAKRGREYWPRGCRVAKPKPTKATTPRMPWYGLRGAEKHRVRWQHDPKYRLYHRLKRWMQKHLRDGRCSVKWSKALGYQPDDLARHLERQFTKGMGWHNMGEWHIDHIVPVREFEFSSAHDEEFKACYSLANLRPMWARDNLAKRGDRTHLL